MLETKEHSRLEWGKVGETLDRLGLRSEDKKVLRELMGAEIDKERYVAPTAEFTTHHRQCDPNKVLIPFPLGLLPAPKEEFLTRREDARTEGNKAFRFFEEKDDIL